MTDELRDQLGRKRLAAIDGTANGLLRGESIEMAIAQSQAEESGNRQQEHDRNEEAQVIHASSLRMYTANEMPDRPVWMQSR